MQKLSNEKIIEMLSVKDLTNSLNGVHSIQLIMNKILKKLKNEMNLDIQIHRNSSIVSLEDNYNYLLYPKDGAARDSKYTKYISDNLILRTQTSSMIPSILKDLSITGIEKDTLMACPGLVYRRDTIDKLHVPNPHQLDLWIISNEEKNENDLIKMIDIVMKETIGKIEYKLTPAKHPYTENGLQIDVKVNNTWIEVGECGIASSKVLSLSGLPLYGLAMGLGLDRLTMIAKKISDIRLLRSEEPLISKQMKDLLVYKDVSKMPACKKDISVAVDINLEEEQIGDLILENYPEATDVIEEIKILTSTPYNVLPESAKNRMGISPEQKNLLIRITLKSLSKTLTTEEAKNIRNNIYNLIHKGTKKEEDYL